MKQKLLLIAALLMVFLLPLAGSYLRWDGLPPGYGIFPAQKTMNPPPFEWKWQLLAFFLPLPTLSTLLLLFPRLFGFKKIQLPAAHVPEKKVSYPVWFWVGLPLMLLSWFFMWGPLPLVKDIAPYTFVPLWWGFILLLDGLVYKRSQGVSLISKRPNTLKIMALVSLFAWYAFEYLNYFVLCNWYYPNDKIFSNFGNITWQLISYTTVLPAMFECFFLLRTFPSLRARYAQGPKIVASQKVQLLIFMASLVLMILTGYFPIQLFWMLWLCLALVLVPAMGLVGLRTPFTSIARKGDWSNLLLMGLATLSIGFFWEFWNFGSQYFHEVPTNPNYWQYDVPYLEFGYFFSEMPILGYYGYLFFGVQSWALWLVSACVFGFEASVGEDSSP